MRDNRSNTVKTICHKYTNEGVCRTTCPLSNPCKMRHGDNDEIFTSRMNRFADGLNVSIPDQLNAVNKGVI